MLRYVSYKYIKFVYTLRILHFVTNILITSLVCSKLVVNNGLMKIDNSIDDLTVK